MYSSHVQMHTHAHHTPHTHTHTHSKPQHTAHILIHVHVPVDLKERLPKSVKSSAVEGKECRGAPQELIVWEGIFNRAVPFLATSRKSSATTGTSHSSASFIFLLILSTSSAHQQHITPSHHHNILCTLLTLIAKTNGCIFGNLGNHPSSHALNILS